jgi:hypothetical protein
MGFNLPIKRRFDKKRMEKLADRFKASLECVYCLYIKNKRDLQMTEAEMEYRAPKDLLW